MTQILFAVFQEELGGSEFQGAVTTPQAALAWVQELQRIYQLTHRDPIQEEAHKEGVRRWTALYANWEIRPIPVRDSAPVLEPPAHVQLAVRLLSKVDPNARLEDLPPELQEVVQPELELAGAGVLGIGRDEEVGWFVLHIDPDLFYVIDVERPSVDLS